MPQKTAIIFIGIQASGKSTFYHERFKDYVHINLDTLHTRNKENILIQECVESGRSFVVDNTNPTREDREKYIRTAKDNGYCIHGYYFQSSVSDCIARNQKREGKARIPDHAVAGTYRKLLNAHCYWALRKEGKARMLLRWNWKGRAWRIRMNCCFKKE